MKCMLGGDCDKVVVLPANLDGQGLVFIRTRGAIFDSAMWPFVKGFPRIGIIAVLARTTPPIPFFQ
jgi:hypothetical protein